MTQSKLTTLAGLAIALGAGVTAAVGSYHDPSATAALSIAGAIGLALTAFGKSLGS